MLVAIIASLDDTCLLHRGGLHTLRTSQDGARRVIAHGGGAADLLAAPLFLDSLRRLP